MHRLINYSEKYSLFFFKLLCRKFPLLADNVTADHGNLTNFNTRNKPNNSTILSLSCLFLTYLCSFPVTLDFRNFAYD